MKEIDSIEYKGYKAFSEEARFESVKNVNLIIGKNNSGKSSSLDVIKKVFCNNQNVDISFKIKEKISSEEIAKYFRDDIRHGWIGNISEYEYGLKYINNDIIYNVNNNSIDIITPEDREYVSCLRDLASKKFSDIKKKYIREISSERNISPEPMDFDRVFPDGRGITSLISQFINRSDLDERKVENDFLDALNSILGTDSHYDGIRVQQIRQDDGKPIWEIFLIENGNRYALSKMGSGLKTIIMVLVNLMLLDEKEKSLFVFEELENNLHPFLQRRLFEFIYNYADKNDLLVFLTSHSHVSINCFFGKEKASIYHVYKEGVISKLELVESSLEKIKILDDLDVRASDLLQTNGIIWVEGPSDRIYINKWISLLDKDLKENVHYSFAYYGGKLLSHYTVSENEGLLNILLTNRNSCIVIDSDKRTKEEKINSTKQRIKDEFEKNNLFCWITAGKEIENYIPRKAVNDLCGSNYKQIGIYELFPEYIKEHDGNFSSHKVEFANEITQYISSENYEVLDCKEKVEHIVQLIKKWNKM